ncbi:hypothetical protein MWU60_09780 [Yoonia sp. F2084L]|uniref:hypothetical protein n=1 Tax=Yoonia sp. F2084L TaxID=2926419 RepID=UPI001FF2EE73|nr:hypothetical protein [Yoonia sp. F2084L]MCK0095854.1 hypothetical protein [Yoonia sp. F2084L]
MVGSELDALRNKFSGCRALAFADLSTKMILITDSDSNLRREALDALCGEATVLFGAKGKPALGERQSNAACVASPSAFRAFVRAADEPNDVLCCICDPKVDAAAFVTEARACVDRISRGA